MSKIRILLALYLMAFYLPARPPEPVVSFVYDPNSINYEIIEAVRVYPQEQGLSFVRKVVEPDGQLPYFTCSDPSVVIGNPVISIDLDPDNVVPDPNDPTKTIRGPSLIYTYECIFPTNRPPGVYGLDFETGDNDPNEPMFDGRSMLVLVWPKNRPPQIR